MQWLKLEGSSSERFSPSSRGFSIVLQNASGDAEAGRGERKPKPKRISGGGEKENECGAHEGGVGLRLGVERPKALLHLEGAACLRVLGILERPPPSFTQSERRVPEEEC